MRLGGCTGWYSTYKETESCQVAWWSIVFWRWLDCNASSKMTSSFQNDTLFLTTLINYLAPISLLTIQMPNNTSKPEWKLSSEIVTVPDLPLNLLVSTLRNRILQHTGSTISASHIWLSYQEKMLTNSSSIMATNLEHEDPLMLSVHNQKKRWRPWV